MLVGLEPRDERREQERRVEAGVSAAGSPEAQGTRGAPPVQRAAQRHEGRADRRPALGVGVEHQAGPGGGGLRAGDEVCRRRRLVVDDGLLLCGEGCLRARVRPAVDDDREPAGADERRDLDLDVVRLDPHLREPEPMLLHEVEAEDVPAGRTRRVEMHVDRHLLPGSDGAREGGPDSVPDDRVPAGVEPVVGDLQPVLAPRAPRRRAAVLEDEVRGRRPARPLRGDRRLPPDGCERLHEGECTERGGYAPMVSDPLLVRAARRQPVERTPVWFMRQAGRSLPEYRAIRERHSFFEVAGTPELCAEVTLQPVHRHGVDAAVMFADIMTPVLGMGIDVELVEGVGPVIDRPIRTARDVERLRVPDPEEAFGHVLEAVRLVRSELSPDSAVIGFCGGPFTVAGYLVEGRPSRELPRTKALMLAEPETWDALLEKLSDTFAAYVAAKVRAGADAIQLFDSWVGTLSTGAYRHRVARWSARILAAVDVPTIHFGTGAYHLLAELSAAGGDVIGLDWRVPLDEGWARVGDRAVQGNLDPATLLAPWEAVEREARDVLDRAAGRPGHVFNLGHGVLPDTDPAVLTRLVDLVRERSEATVAA